MAPIVVHVLPDDDAIGHEASHRCVCGPHRESLGEAVPRLYASKPGPHRVAWVPPRLDGRSTNS